ATVVQRHLAAPLATREVTFLPEREPLGPFAASLATPEILLLSESEPSRSVALALTAREDDPSASQAPPPPVPTTWWPGVVWALGAGLIVARVLFGQLLLMRLVRRGRMI